MLHYCLYLCVGVWKWYRAGTPVDLGFPPRVVLKQLSDAASKSYNSLTLVNAVKFIACAIFIIAVCVFLCVYVCMQIVSLTAALFSPLHWPFVYCTRLCRQ